MMSLEAALDEERREVLDILEGRGRPASKQGPSSGRSSPAPSTAPIRSMLDVSTRNRHGSIAGIGVGITPSASATPLAPSGVSRPEASITIIAPPSSSSSSKESGLDEPHRRSSDSATQVPAARRKVQDKPGVDINTDYQFRMLPSIPGMMRPKRVTQGPGMRAQSKASSPSPRLRTAASPARPASSAATPAVSSSKSRYVTDSGKVIDMDHAYRHLSTAALAKSGGGLALRSRLEAARNRDDRRDSLSEDADGRLQEDDYDGLEEGSDRAHSTDDENDDSSSIDDDLAPQSTIEPSRGRKKLVDALTTSGGSGKAEAGHRRRPLSLLAAAEEERKLVAASRKVRSLLDIGTPRLNVEKPLFKKTGVHPQTSFDYTMSVSNTPVGSDDDADLSDIKHAQNLSIQMSTVDNSIPNRAIRTIIRGDFTRLQQEADHGHRRQRKYLVATDLSDESVYALEWTIGTILRDGDTLFTVYAIDEESGTGKAAELSASVPVGEGAKVIQDSAAVIGSQTEKTALKLQSNAASLLPQALSSYFGGSDSRSVSVHSRGISTVDSERVFAVERISQTCVRLLRKTRLQVRVAVEVIHCKSPKQLITEAIDGLEPTLVIIGSRGRSALKGVLLGSFSNYIITKSSVPVMVARKKLKKHTKYKSTHVRLSNNLTTPKSLALAKVD